MSKLRKEKDFLGERDIPSDAYWGIHTLRAQENFSFTAARVNPRLIRALAKVKKAACLTNQELKFLPDEKARVITAACDEIMRGELSNQFPVDALQGGAGTSTNMNLNEVIANRALELAGFPRGAYEHIHPLEDVNLHQSTNDVYPTAVKVAAIGALRELSEAIARFQGVLQKKEKEFTHIVKVGRTEMKEAVPITLGAEFGAFAEAIARDRWRASKSEERLRVVNIGGTAVGTGLCAPRKYIFLVIEKLRAGTGFGLSRGENLLDATANTDCFVEVSGILKAHAVNLIKIANDLRLMSLLQEIELPALQVGSSIMAGKINPVMLEATMQGALKVVANDGIVSDAASRSTLQINEFMPLLADAFLQSLDILIAIDAKLADHLGAVKANPGVCQHFLDRSPTLITAFLPHIGYERANELLQEFASTGKENLREFLIEKLGAGLVEKVLDSHALTSLGFKINAKDT